MNRARLVLAALAVLMVMLGLGSAAQAAPAAALAAQSGQYIARPGERVEVFQAPLIEGSTGKIVGTVPVEKVTSPQPLAIEDCPHYGSVRRFCIWSNTQWTGARWQWATMPGNACVNFVPNADNNAESAYNGTLTIDMVIYSNFFIQNGEVFAYGGWASFDVNGSTPNITQGPYVNAINGAYVGKPLYNNEASALCHLVY